METASRFSLGRTAVISAALVACCAAAITFAQTPVRSVTIEVLDGRNGKPIEGTHLLIFAGSTSEEVRQHHYQYDLLTDGGGVARFVLTSDSLKFMQVWVDGKTLCQSQPNSLSFSIEQMLAQGLSAPNQCGQAQRSAKPGELLIFARPSTFAEKMRH